MDNAKIEETQKDLVLVTGATGFIAMHIVKILLEKGYKVKGTVRNLKEEKKIQIMKRLVPNSVGDLEFVEADLTKEDGWIEAVKGCKYVLHTASPFPVEIPKNEEDLIKPAFKGTLILLRACVENNSKVKRVVLTGSCSSMFGDKFIENHVYTEKDWPYFRKLYPYSKSKHLAEKAAWDFVKERTDKHLPCFELAVVNPGYVLGPILHDESCTSIKAIKSLMTNDIPFLPHYNFPVCDVRDVALAHERVMILPEANNNRHIIVSRRDCLSFKELALTLENEFKSRNYKLPTIVAPNLLIRLYSIFHKPIKQINLNLGRNATFDNTRMVEVLRIKPTPLNESICEMAYSLIDKKIIPKKF